MKSDRKSNEAAASADANSDVDAKLSISELLSNLHDIHSTVGTLFVDLEARARTTAQEGDWTAHAMFSRISHVCAEFKHYLGGALDDAEARQAKGA